MDFKDDANAGDNFHAGLVARPAISEPAKAHGRYRFECRDKDGNLKWVEEFDNIWTTVGMNDALTQYLKGSAYTAAWYMGLIDNAGFSQVLATDTMATHAGWTENQQYDEASRPTMSFGTAGSGSLATSSACTFTMNATATINGAFVASNATKGGTTGILFSEKSFTSPRSVVSSDVLNVSYTASLS